MRNAFNWPVTSVILRDVDLYLATTKCSGAECGLSRWL